MTLQEGYLDLTTAEYLYVINDDGTVNANGFDISGSSAVTASVLLGVE